MSPTAVIQFGAFKFSLVYIAIIFGGLQFFGFLEADTLERFFEQRPDQLALLQALPLWIIITTVALTSMLIGWLTGILVTFNRYFNFKLWMEGDKLQKRHGLLTLSEGTIPLRKVQILILKANVPMRFFRRFGLELQTMGLDPSQSGRRVAVPMAHLLELIQLIPSVFPEFRMPDRFEPVSKLTIRRMSIRYSLMTLLVLAPVIYFWNPAGWALIALPMVYPLALLQYRHHGYCVDGDTLYVKRGVWQHYLWIVPVDKIQTLHTSQSIFQRRLGLATLHVDTAGSASTNYPQTLDLTLETAQELMESLYAHFQTLFESGKATRTGILPSEKVPDEPDSRQG